jgi:hypothetical protein
MSLSSQWRKSTRSGGSGNCVEVRLVQSDVSIRDSKDSQGLMLTVAPTVWQDFVSGLRAGNFLKA